MRQFILHKISQLILHSLFWASVLLFYTLFYGYESQDFSYILSFSLFIIPITITTTYVVIYKLIPEYLITKRYILFGIATPTMIKHHIFIVLLISFSLCLEVSKKTNPS